MKTGTVQWFNAEMGYGFIQPDDGGSEVFVHIRAVELSGMDDLKEGQRLNFIHEREHGQVVRGGSQRRLTGLTSARIRCRRRRGSVRISCQAEP